MPPTTGIGPALRHLYTNDNDGEITLTEFNAFINQGARTFPAPAHRLTPNQVQLLLAFRNGIWNGSNDSFVLTSSNNTLLNNAIRGQSVTSTHISEAFPSTTVSPPSVITIGNQGDIPQSVVTHLGDNAQLIIGTGLINTGGGNTDRIIVYLGNETTPKLHIMRIPASGFNANTSLVLDMTINPSDVTRPILNSTGVALRLQTEDGDASGLAEDAPATSTYTVTSDASSQSTQFLQHLFTHLQNDLSSLHTIGSFRVRSARGLNNLNISPWRTSAQFTTTAVSNPALEAAFRGYFTDSTHGADRLNNTGENNTVNSSDYSPLFELQGGADRTAMLVRVHESGGGIHYRLLVRQQRSGDRVSFMEYRITQAGLQRLATELGVTVNWSSLSSVRDFIAGYIRIDSDPAVAAFHRRLGYAQLRDLTLGTELSNRVAWSYSTSWSSIHANMTDALALMRHGVVKPGDDHDNLDWDNSYYLGYSGIAPTITPLANANLPPIVQAYQALIPRLYNHVRNAPTANLHASHRNPTHPPQSTLLTQFSATQNGTTQNMQVYFQTDPGQGEGFTVIQWQGNPNARTSPWAYRVAFITREQLETNLGQSLYDAMGFNNVNHSTTLTSQQIILLQEFFAANRYVATRLGNHDNTSITNDPNRRSPTIPLYQLLYGTSQQNYTGGFNGWARHYGLPQVTRPNQ